MKCNYPLVVILSCDVSVAVSVGSSLSRSLGVMVTNDTPPYNWVCPFVPINQVISFLAIRFGPKIPPQLAMIRFDDEKHVKNYYERERNIKVTRSTFAWKTKKKTFLDSSVSKSEIVIWSSFHLTWMDVLDCFVSFHPKFIWPHIRLPHVISPQFISAQNHFTQQSFHPTFN